MKSLQKDTKSEEEVGKKASKKCGNKIVIEESMMYTGALRETQKGGGRNCGRGEKLGK